MEDVLHSRLKVNNVKNKTRFEFVFSREENFQNHFKDLCTNENVGLSVEIPNGKPKKGDVIKIWNQKNENMGSIHFNDLGLVTIIHPTFVYSENNNKSDKELGDANMTWHQSIRIVLDHVLYHKILKNSQSK